MDPAQNGRQKMNDDLELSLGLAIDPLVRRFSTLQERLQKLENSLTQVNLLREEVSRQQNSVERLIKEGENNTDALREVKKGLSNLDNKLNQLKDSTSHAEESLKQDKQGLAILLLIQSLITAGAVVIGLWFFPPPPSAQLQAELQVLYAKVLHSKPAIPLKRK